MTNDVKRISEYVTPKNPTDNCISDLMAAAKKDIYIGDTEKAKRSLLGYKFDLIKESKYANINALGINNKLIKEIDELLATIDKGPNAESIPEKNVIKEIKNDIPPHNKWICPECKKEIENETDMCYYCGYIKNEGK